MSNINGNIYPAWGISAENQVIAVDTSNAVYPMSDPNFAEMVAISESGIVWVISTNPDPASGSVLYWGKGDGVWNSVGNTPGAVIVTGGQGTGAVFVTEDGQVWATDVNGESEMINTIDDLQELDFGGGYLWALFPGKPGGPPYLQYAQVDQTPLQWKAFSGYVNPSGISVNYNGDCYGATDFSPMFYSSDGTSSGSAGAGADGSTLAVTFKNTFYLLSTNANNNGNDVWVWQDTAGGTFVNAGFQAIQILATYYLGQ